MLSSRKSRGSFLFFSSVIDASRYREAGATDQQTRRRRHLLRKNDDEMLSSFLQNEIIREEREREGEKERFSLVAREEMNF